MNQISITAIILLVSLFGIAAFIYLTLKKPQKTPVGKPGSQPISHQDWDILVRNHIAQDGMVDYKGFILDRPALEDYLDLLSKNPPAQAWPEAEKLAYWINAYNAFTVKVIIDNYPLKSIRTLHQIPFFPLVGSVWHRKFFSIGGQKASLDQIEHSILRKEFNEPRIHFAINCASMSCPVLRREAYTADKLETQLTEQAQFFLTHPIRNIISENEVQLSPIFWWFKGDFTRDGDLIEFINQYSPLHINPEADISYLDYDWSLNEQP